MSSNSNNTVALGSRVNIFDSQTGEFDSDRNPKDETKPSHDEERTDEPDIPSVDDMLGRGDTHTQVMGINRDAWVAGSILRSYENPPIFCPECWYEFETESELSDPEHYVPRVEVDHEFDTDSLEHSLEISKNDHRKHRHCPDCGAVSFGGVLGDRDTETFREILDYVFDAVDELVMSRRDRLASSALARKSEGMSDESNMEQLVRDLREN